MVTEVIKRFDHPLPCVVLNGGHFLRDFLSSASYLQWIIADTVVNVSS